MYNNAGFSRLYLPKRDQSSITRTTKIRSESENNSYLDDYYDLKRWVSSGRDEINTYVQKKLLLDYEKEFDNGNDQYIDIIRNDISETKSFLIDIRKGIDWYKLNYDTKPDFLIKFYDELNHKNIRLKKLKRYLSKRLRQYAAYNVKKNENLSIGKTKFMKKYVDYNLKAIDIFLSQKDRFSVRKNTYLFDDYEN